jgi:hypothetical protein
MDIHGRRRLTRELLKAHFRMQQARPVGAKQRWCRRAARLRPVARPPKPLSLRTEARSRVNVPEAAIRGSAHRIRGPTMNSRLARFLSIFLCSCGPGKLKDRCNDTSDCGKGLVCIYVCPDPWDCPGGVCRLSCQTDSDCPGECSCILHEHTGGPYCRGSGNC